MLRRPPTRLELKPEDRQEYEDIKRRREEEEAAAAGNQTRPGSSLRELDKLKESVQERIGLKR